IGRAQDGLPDCNQALSLLSRGSEEASADVLEQRGYAYFRLGQYQRAIQDYDAALKRNARLATALYGRGLAKQRLGNPQDEADITAAKAITHYIAGRMEELGVAP